MQPRSNRVHISYDPGLLSPRCARASTSTTPSSVGRRSAKKGTDREVEFRVKRHTRRHIHAVAVEYIGKEANRWEEQFHVGNLPEALIDYGLSAEAQRGLVRVIRRAARSFGVTALATSAALSRQQLSAVLAKAATPRTQTLARLVRAIAHLESEKREREAERKARAAQRVEVNEGILARVAAKFGLDPSGLSKSLSGKRGIGPR